MQYGAYGVTKKQSFYKGVLKGTQEYEYDNNGNMIKETITLPATPGAAYKEWEYDNNGNLVRMTYDADGEWEEHTYDNEYDNTGKLVKVTEYWQTKGK